MAETTTWRPPSPPLSPGSTASSNDDVPLSDLPHLIRTHHNAGYRDGLSDGKASAPDAQSAFDGGFAEGAALGARAGWVLGMLEMLAEVEGQISGSKDWEKIATGNGRDVSNGAFEVEIEGSLRNGRVGIANGLPMLDQAKQALAIEKLCMDMQKGQDVLSEWMLRTRQRAESLGVSVVPPAYSGKG
ncbi:hypothetical protein MRB53_037410 [Persea americana]|nr:hypothetical protein MRB53_037410 [Persea americana]